MAKGRPQVGHSAPPAQHVADEPWEFLIYLFGTEKFVFVPLFLLSKFLVPNSPIEETRDSRIAVQERVSYNHYRPGATDIHG